MEKKNFSIVLIIIGLLILLYPKGLELYNDYKQQKMIKKWKGNLLNLEEDYKKCTNKEDYFLKNQGKVQKSEYKKRESLNNNIEGILKIDKINLELPVLSGATYNNLKISIASIECTGKPGEIGNYAIAGHRSRTFGRNFNRLDEMKKGDIIKIIINRKVYKYTIVEKLYVKPEETWVLNGNNKDREITLITCHPILNPTHRLIIKGKILE